MLCQLESATQSAPPPVDVESWPLGERIDVLASLVLHEGFTVNWDFDVD
jgi:hypothetical protein